MSKSKKKCLFYLLLTTLITLQGTRKAKITTNFWILYALKPLMKTRSTMKEATTIKPSNTCSKQNREIDNVSEKHIT